MFPINRQLLQFCRLPVELIPIIHQLPNHTRKYFLLKACWSVHIWLPFLFHSYGGIWSILTRFLNLDRFIAFLVIRFLRIHLIVIVYQFDFVSDILLWAAYHLKFVWDILLFEAVSTSALILWAGWSRRPANLLDLVWDILLLGARARAWAWV